MPRIHRASATSTAARRSMPGRRWRRAFAAIALGAVAASSILAAAPASAAPTAGSSTAQVTIRQTTDAAQLAGSTHQYALKWACASAVSSVCATDAVITIPFDVPTATVKVATGAGGRVESWAQENGAITLRLGTISSGSSGEIPLSITTQNWHTPNATSWTLKPAFASTATGTVASTASVTSTATSELKLWVWAPAEFTHYGPGAQIPLKSQVSTYCNISSGVGVMGVDRLRVERSLPDGVRFVSAEDGGQWDPATRTVTWERIIDGGATDLCDLITNMTAQMGTADDGLSENQEVSFPTTLTVWPNDGSAPVSKTEPTTVRYTAAAATAGTVTSYGSSPFLHTAGEPASRAPAGYRTGIPAAEPVALDAGFASEVSQVVTELDQPAGTTYPGVEFQPACRLTPSATLHVGRGKGELCTDPAFNVLEFAIGDGSWPWWKEFETTEPPADWVTARLTDGTTINVPTVFEGWEYRAKMPAEIVGRVASVHLKAVPGVATTMRTLHFRGTADADLAKGVEMRSTTHATWHAQTGGAVAGENSDVAITYVVDGAQTSMTWTGMVNATVYTPGNLTDDVVLTALLPNGEDTAREGTVPTQVWAQPWSAAALDRIDAEQLEVVFPITWEATPNWQGTGNTLMRSRIPAETVNNLLNGGPGRLFGVPSFNPNPHGVSPATIPYTVHYAGKNTDVCSTGGHASAVTTRVTSDPTDLDANPNTSIHCRLAVTTAGDAWNSPEKSMQVTTQVSTPANPTYSATPKTATTTANGTISNRAIWVNNGKQDLSSVGVYALLPRPTDTGSLPHNADAPRGSTIAPAFTGLGTLPTGTSVSYSRAANPCRAEVLPDNPGCVDDWTAVAPTNLTEVTALRFTVPGDQAYGSRLTFNWNTRTPAGATGAAYATAAAFASAGGDPLPSVESAPAVAATTSYEHLAVRTWIANAVNGELAKDQTTDLRVEAANDGLTAQSVDSFVNVLPLRFTPTRIGAGGTYDADTHTVTWPGTTLAPGGRFAAIVVGEVDPDGPTEQMTNRFRAVGNDKAAPLIPCETAPTTDACTSVSMIGTPRFVLSGTFNRDTADVGDEVQFTFRGANDGHGPGRMSSTDMPYDAEHLELVSSTPDIDWVSEGYAGWDGVNLAAGEAVEYTMTFKVLPAAAGRTIQLGVTAWNDETHLNPCEIYSGYPAACDSLQVTGDAPVDPDEPTDPDGPDEPTVPEPDRVEVEVQTEVCTVLDLAACDVNPSLWGSASEAPTRGEAYWRVSARNTGNVPLTGVTVTHPLPADLELVPGSATATAGDLADWPDTWAVGDLAGGDTAELTYRTRTPAEPAEAVSRAVLVADNPADSSFPLIGFSEATLQVSDWGVSVTSQVCTDPAGTTCDTAQDSHWTSHGAATAGTAAITRTTVTNTGTAPLRNLTVQSLLPPGAAATGKPHATSGSVTNAGQAWQVDRLAAGKSVTLTRPVRLPKVGGKARFPVTVAAVMSSGDQQGETLTARDEAVVSTRAEKGAANVSVTVEGCRLSKGNCLTNGRKNWSVGPDVKPHKGLLWRVTVRNTGTREARHLTLRAVRWVKHTNAPARRVPPVAKVRILRTLQPGEQRVILLRTPVPKLDAAATLRATVRTRAASQRRLVASARATVRPPRPAVAD